MNTNTFPFNIPEAAQTNLASTIHKATLAYLRYTHQGILGELAENEQDKNDTSPWMLDALEWWNFCNKPIFDALKKEISLSGFTEKETALLFHLSTAFNDLETILNVARTTWMHDPAIQRCTQKDDEHEQGECTQ